MPRLSGKLDDPHPLGGQRPEQDLQEAVVVGLGPGPAAEAEAGGERGDGAGHRAGPRLRTDAAPAMARNLAFLPRRSA